MTKERRLYAIPAWREERPDTFWKDEERRKWYELFKNKVILMLKEMGLEQNKEARAFAQNLWYYAHADEEMISSQLTLYKLNII